MENRIYNKENGLWYEQQGDYFLPCLKLPEQEDVEIGVWGNRRRQYLREHHRIRYYNLLTEGKLLEHLADVEQQAQEMFNRLVDELAAKEGVTEKLKADDMMTWVRKMNNISSRANEIVFNEVIFPEEDAH